ncbi:dihydrofolate reductase [Clostridium sardiniense]|uniref:Dihydrofolate reductase n=1 Tax=Clostridium sardiniense TaxID=29369 RepID=A0ABS7L230_CLOSR|nr:dihydrofolate reductase [Clostridium sardiniense]MBY0757124.1 dihydrofolate reductase [Clostridium sardiniense]MDQ0461418.1 dihydrofolate reductase [Clostridium sardiniense]
MLSIIVATAQNNAIGKDNSLLWHISEDLKRFKEITSGNKILMGRKTFESLPGILPNRPHIVLTRDINFSVDSDKVTVIHNLDEVISNYKNSDEEIFIIGGGEIYNLLMPYADKLYLTKVKKDFNADTFFPQINMNKWEVIHTSGDKTDDKSGLIFEFIDLIRK